MPWFNCAVSKNHYSTFMCQIVNSYPIGPISWPQTRLREVSIDLSCIETKMQFIGQSLEWIISINKKKRELKFWISMFADCEWGGLKVEEGFEHASLFHRDVSTFDSSNTDFFSNFLVLKFQPSNFKTSSYDQYAFIITERQWRLWCVSRNCEHSWLRCKTPLLTPLHLVCATRYLSQQ